MTCARREAGAHRPAASIPSRSPSSGPTPPGDRSRPEPRGGRARLALLLPVLALLLGALPATPAVAQTVWSTTLTVDQDRNARTFGCDDSAPVQGDCSDSAFLTDNDFTHGGTTYTLGALYWDSSNGNLYFRLAGVRGPTTESRLAGLTLLVNGVPFAVNDAISQSNLILWTSSGLAWTDGQRVSLRLTATKFIYGLRLTDFKVTKGGLTR